MNEYLKTKGNTFKEFFNSLFMTKKKREALAETPQPEREVKSMTITE